MDFQVNEIAKALALAKRDGNEEAASELRELLKSAYAEESRQLYNPLDGMSEGEKYAANYSAGVRQFGRGLVDLASDVTGIPFRSNDDVLESRARDAALAESVPGGGAVQMAGNIVPSLALPPVAGAAAKVPWLAARGVGSRLVPTMIAEGSGSGALLGAMQETADGESRLGNAAAGAVGGAAIPVGAGALGWVGRKVVPNVLGGGKLSERAAARAVTRTVKGTGNAAAQDASLNSAERSLRRYDRAMQQGLDVPPASTAMVTANKGLAVEELADRARPDRIGNWSEFDAQLDQSRWDILDRRLPRSSDVAQAEANVDDWVVKNMPRLKQTREAPQAYRDFDSAVRAQAITPANLSSTSARKVYAHIRGVEARLRKEGKNWNPQALWNVRKDLKKWMETGRNPRTGQIDKATDLDSHIMQATTAIDNTLDRATGGKWSSFIADLADQSKAAGQVRAGNKIRGVFQDEAQQGMVRGASTPLPGGGEVPRLSPTRLEKAYTDFGQNKFGSTLSTDADDAVRAVRDNLRQFDTVQNTKGAGTGRGGSFTTPLRGLIARGTNTDSGLVELGARVARYLDRRDQLLMTRALEDPQFALQLLRNGRKQLSPLAWQDLQALAQLQRAAGPVAAGVAGAALPQEGE